MLDDTQQSKVKVFLKDRVMAEAVRKVLLASFLKPRGDKDVHTLAAAKIAIDLLDEGFKELDRLKDPKEEPGTNPMNIGL